MNARGHRTLKEVDIPKKIADLTSPVLEVASEQELRRYRLRQLRSERGLSQVALAQTLGISASYLNQIEHDARPLTASVLRRITEAFGVDAGFFDSQDDIRLVAELREVLLDDDVEAGPGAQDAQQISAMVASHPEIARRW